MAAVDAEAAAATELVDAGQVMRQSPVRGGLGVVEAVDGRQSRSDRRGGRGVDGLDGPALAVEDLTVGPDVAVGVAAGGRGVGGQAPEQDRPDGAAEPQVRGTVEQVDDVGAEAADLAVDRLALRPFGQGAAGRCGRPVDDEAGLAGADQPRRGGAGPRGGGRGDDVDLEPPAGQRRRRAGSAGQAVGSGPRAAATMQIFISGGLRGGAIGGDRLEVPEQLAGGARPR